MDVNFCRRCGAHVKLTAPGTYKCQNGHHLYYKPNVGVNVAVVNDRREVLLIVRAVEPNKGMLDLPGGFIDVGESFEHAATRELKEEVGLEVDNLHYLMSAAEEYRYEEELQYSSNVTFVAHVQGRPPVKAADDAVSIKWVALNDLDFTEVVPMAARDALKLLQNKTSA